MLKVPEAHRFEFEEELAEKLVIGCQTGALLLVFLFPIFGVLDAVMYRFQAWELLQIRLVLTLIEVINLLVLHLLVQRGVARRYVNAVSWCILYPAVIALDLIIVKVGGPESPYYAGLGLVLLGMIVTTPWSFKEMSVHSLFIWLQYLGLMYVFKPELDDWRIFFSNNFFMLSMITIGLAWTYNAHDLRIKEFLARKELSHEKERSEQLLLNILPAEVAEELKRNGQVEARDCPSATILFTDFAGFTSISTQIPAPTLVESLHRLFTGFDQIITRHGLEKLKTIGDAYMCVGGLPTPRAGHLFAAVLAALEIVDFLARVPASGESGQIRWQARLGVHFGPVIAGVIGNRKFAYDVWGDTVNLASRLESASEPGRINVTTALFQVLKPYFLGTDRGYLPVKGKGPVAMTFVDRIRPELSADPAGYYPNALFWKAVRTSPYHALADRPLELQNFEGMYLEQRGDVMHMDLWAQLKGLTEKDCRTLEQISRPFSFKIGDPILVQGVLQDSLLVVLEGHVAVRVEQDDTRIDVSILGPGDLLGEMGFVTGEPASASVVAIEPGRALRLQRADLEQVLADDVSFSARLYHALANLMAVRLRETTSRLPPLIVEEVAHTRLHHTMITGQDGAEGVPASLLEAVEHFKTGMHQLDRALARAPEVVEQHHQQTKQLCDGLKAALTLGLNEVADRGPAFQDGVGSYVFRETFPYFMLSRMIDRSFSKPRGYAGDYYTIELIHLQQPSGDRRLGVLIDREYLASPPCLAVRNRRALMASALCELYEKRPPRGENFLVTSLASGAGREVFDFMSTLPDARTVFASLLDIDVEALTYSSHLAAELGLQSQVLFAKENVLFLAAGRGKTRLPPQDVIYSIGLADYLKDEIIVKLMNWIYDHLKVGGTAVVGNFGVDNPDREFMDHILDWRLYHRSVADMQRLFSQSRFGQTPVDVRVEPAGVNLVAFCQRTQGRPTPTG